MTKIGWTPFKRSYSNPEHMMDWLDLVIQEPKKLTGFYKVKHFHLQDVLQMLHF